MTLFTTTTTPPVSNADPDQSPVSASSNSSKLSDLSDSGGELEPTVSVPKKKAREDTPFPHADRLIQPLGGLSAKEGAAGTNTAQGDDSEALCPKRAAVLNHKFVKPAVKPDGNIAKVMVTTGHAPAQSVGSV